MKRQIGYMKRQIACNSVCKSKKKFENKSSADKRCGEINDNDIEAFLRVYKCNACRGYHLTSKTESDQKKIRKFILDSQVKHDLHYERQIENEANYWIKKKGW
jgi:hypothetical protein